MAVSSDVNGNAPPVPGASSPVSPPVRRWRWRKLIERFSLVSAAAVAGVFIQYLSLADERHSWPYDDYLREASLTLSNPDLVPGEDTPIQMSGERAPRGYTVWIAGQDDAGHWFPLSQAYWDSTLGAYTTTIRNAQIFNVETIRLHPVIANSEGQAGLREYQIRGDKTVGLDELPGGSVAADQ